MGTPYSCTSFLYLHLGGLAYGGVPAVAGHHQSRLNAQSSSVRPAHLNPGDMRPVCNDVDGFVLDAEIEREELLGLPDQKIEEIPLRHERNKSCAGREAAEIGCAKRKITERSADGY